MSRKMADRVSIVAVSIAAFLTTINQISIIITAKQLWMCYVQADMLIIGKWK